MKITSFILALLAPFFVFSQQMEGEILYTESIKLQIDLPEDVAQNMKGQFPTSQSFTRVLLFNASECLYKDPDPTDDEDLEFKHEEDGMDFNIVMKRPENIYFTNLEEGQTINKREFFGRLFLIEGNRKSFAWKLTGEQKKIGEYTCQKAVCTDEERQITAWFTPQVPVSAGPGEFGGLPGLILEVDIDNGQRTVTASRIEIKELEKNAIVQPDKGKRVSQEEFKEIEAEKMKEMETEMGGSGQGIKVIIRN